MLYWMFSSPFVWIIFIYLIYSHFSVSRRLRALEGKINGKPTTQTSPLLSPKPAQVSPVMQFGADEVPAQVAPSINLKNYDSPVYSQPAEPNKLEAWLKEDWLMKLGALVFIVGFGWFVSYAFANNWIGPVGRITLGILGGVAVMTFGFFRMQKYVSQGAVFMALGTGMGILTIFAGRSVYEFFTPVSAVIFDFIFIAFVAYASYKYKIKSLAQIAQILAFLTPLLTAGMTESVFLFSYLLFISVATLALAGVTGWRDLIVSSLVFVGLYSIPYMGSGGWSYRYAVDAPLILNFAYLFSMLYLFSGMAAVVRTGIQNAKNEIMLAVFNGVFLFMWILNAAPREWQSLLFSVWAVIFATCAFMAFQFSKRIEPFYAYGAVGTAFIAAATARELEGAVLTIAFIIEVALLTAVVSVLTKNVQAVSRASLLFVGPALLSIASVANYANSQTLMNEDFAVLAMMAVGLIVSGRLITHLASPSDDESTKNTGAALVVMGTVYIGYIIWQFARIIIYFDVDMATMAALVIYTVLGLAAYFAGLYGNDAARRTYGAALVAFVVLRLVFLDVWNMELFGRVVTFLAIGVILMSTAFLTKKQKHDVI